MDLMAFLGSLADMEVDEQLRIDDLKATFTASSCCEIIQSLDCTIGEVFSVYVQVIFAYCLTFPCGFPRNVYLEERSRFQKQALVCFFSFSLRCNFLISVSHPFWCVLLHDLTIGLLETVDTVTMIDLNHVFVYVKIKWLLLVPVM